MQSSINSRARARSPSGAFYRDVLSRLTLAREALVPNAADPRWHIVRQAASSSAENGIGKKTRNRAARRAASHTAQTHFAARDTALARTAVTDASRRVSARPANGVYAVVKGSSESACSPARSRSAIRSAPRMTDQSPAEGKLRR